MADVFISYSKLDRDIAMALADELNALGFDVWWDFALYAGDDFHDMIRDEITKAKAVVVIWSETAAASRWVRGEAAEADDLGTLISTHAPGFDPRRVPINFRALHCEPVTNRDRVIGAIERKGAMRQARSTPRDPLAELRARAERGEAAAQAALGYKYEKGLDGLAKDEREAVRLYKLAAEQGDARGQTYLGIMYALGFGGLTEDPLEGVRLVKLAADQGDAFTRYALAAAYKDGVGGLAVDESEAGRLYRLSAAQGLADAQVAVGIMYENGVGGVGKDEREAARFYKLAADQGHPEGQERLADYYELGRGGLLKEEREAVRLYKRAAEQGNGSAFVALKRPGVAFP